jgi:hypothetical protein
MYLKFVFSLSRSEYISRLSARTTGVRSTKHTKGAKNFACTYASRWQSSPLELDGIMSKPSIVADDGHILDLSLRDQQSVERVFMMQRQLVQSQDVIEFYRQQPDVIGFLLIFDHIFQRQAEL